MESKKNFEAPDLEIVSFDVEDVITVSGNKSRGIELPDHDW